MLSIIVAMDLNGLIGCKNNLPWHIPEDLKYFKEITKGKTVVMGRKTYESIGRPLPNRENIILTRDKNYFIDNCSVVHNKEEINHFNKEVFIIGGSEIFDLFLKDVDRFYITHIDFVFDGDVYFPNIDFSSLKEVSKIYGNKDKLIDFNYHFSLYEKN
jgi:dihydrofolate reductase